MSLFDGEPEGPQGLPRTAPLAERMRPRSLEELSGQEHLVGPGKPPKQVSLNSPPSQAASRKSSR
jgi:replication-associated recombination protein RarA